MRWAPLTLLLAVAASAALPDSLRAVLRDLDARATRYTTSMVEADMELPGKLALLQTELDRYAETLPAGESRRIRAVQLSAETAALKARAQRQGLRYNELGRDLRMHVSAVNQLDSGAVVPGPGATAPADRPATFAERFDAVSGRALGILRGGAGSESFLGRELQDAPSGGALLAYANPVRAGVLTSGAAVPAASPAVVVPPLLQRGSPDESGITALQNKLNTWRRANGYRVIDADGDFGPHTAEALRIFQRANGLEQTGSLDEATSAALNRASADLLPRIRSFVQLGDHGPEVLRAQELLNRAAGSRLIREDSDFGGGTARAVRGFQRAHKLSPSGAIDAMTLAVLEAQAASRPELPPAPIIGRRGRLREPGTAPDLYFSARMPADISGWVAAAERRYGIGPNIYRAVVWAEGGAVGNSSVAYGPGQITPSGAGPCIGRTYNGRRVTWALVRDNREINVDCGAYLFSQRYRLPGMPSDANPLIIAATYNTLARNWAGIISSNKIPKIRETTYYVTRISRIYCQWTGQRLLDPQRDLWPDSSRENHRQWLWSRDADGDMERDINWDGYEAREGCSHF